MEERITAKEPQETASGLAFQGFLEALKQKRAAKSSVLRSDARPSTKPDNEDVGSTESGESWRNLTRRKLHERWEQYSPTFKDKLQKYSPNPIKKLRELFSQSEEVSYEEKENDNNVEAMEDEENRNEILQECEKMYKSSAAIHLDDVIVDEKFENGEGVVNLINDSSQKDEVPSESESMCDNEEGFLPGVKSDAKIRKGEQCVEQTPHIVLQEPDSNTNELRVLGIDGDVIHRRKSPLTVQEWVDHLPSKPKLLEKDCEDSSGSKDSDNLATADNPPHEDKRSLYAARLSREASVQSSSSLDSLLDSRRPDPVEVLLNLGFGCVPGVDMEHCRIPKRFLVPSKCKGGDWDEFLRRELIQAQNFECASLGFRGLSGPSHQRPSAIVANIMEKLRERTSPRPPAKSKFSTVARRVLNERSVLNKLAPEPSQSVLNPDNRKFLDSQGKISPEVPRRRIIFGQKSFAFANDGEFIEVEPSSSKPPLPHEDSVISLNSSTSGAETESEDGKPKSAPTALRSSDAKAALKLRRSSLQRQKKIEGDYEDANRIIDNTGQSTGTNRKSYHTDDKFSKKTEKIPVRFVSSGNLILKDKTPEEIRTELEEEIKSLSEKIQYAKSKELASILLQIKDLRARLENQ